MRLTVPNAHIETQTGSLNADLPQVEGWHRYCRFDQICPPALLRSGVWEDIGFFAWLLSVWPIGGWVTGEPGKRQGGAQLGSGRFYIPFAWPAATAALTSLGLDETGGLQRVTRLEAWDVLFVMHRGAEVLYLEPRVTTEDALALSYAARVAGPA